MSCKCIEQVNNKLTNGALDIALIDGFLDIEYKGCRCGEFEEFIEINYCPICGEKIEK
ncbi:MAG: hypothetical protein ACRCTZ_09505 [Sarcina sp.]